MKVIILFLLSFMLVSCGGDKNNKKEGSNKNNLSLQSKEYTGILERHHVALTSSGELAYLKKEEDSLVYSDNSNTVVLKDTPAKRYWLTISGKYVYIFWWVKYNTHEQKDRRLAGKTLYVNVSTNGGKSFSRPHRINDNHGVLPDLHVLANETGKITIVYSDERYKGHQIFTNSSQDGGKTWLKNDLELNQVSQDSEGIKGKERKTSAVTPSLQYLGDKIIAIWEQTESFNGKKGVSFISRESSDFGQTWSPSEMIHRDFDRLSVEMTSVSANDEVYLFAVLEQGLVMFSKEVGGTWHRIKGYVPRTEKDKTDLVSYIKTAFDQQFLYVSYINVEGYNKTENHTEFQAFNRKNKTWVNWQRFDGLDGLAAPFSRSMYQDIKILKDGTLIIVWEDYRGIFPSILMSYSNDQGKTWLNKPIALNKVGLESSSFPFIKVFGDKYHVFYKYFILANSISPKIKTKQLSIASPNSEMFVNIDFPKVSLPSEAESISMIKKRANSLMALRLDKSTKNMEREWGFLDPIYKASTQQASWILNRDTIDYLHYKLEKITFQGTLATAESTITYKMNEKSVIAKANKDLLKLRNERAKMKWGWFYDNWYLIPDNPKQSYLP